jgi:hypothetical protein
MEFDLQVDTDDLHRLKGDHNKAEGIKHILRQEYAKRPKNDFHLRPRFLNTSDPNTYEEAIRESLTDNILSRKEVFQRIFLGEVLEPKQTFATIKAYTPTGIPRALKASNANISKYARYAANKLTQINNQNFTSELMVTTADCAVTQKSGETGNVLRVKKKPKQIKGKPTEQIKFGIADGKPICFNSQSIYKIASVAAAVNKTSVSRQSKQQTEESDMPSPQVNSRQDALSKFVTVPTPAAKPARTDSTTV